MLLAAAAGLQFAVVAARQKAEAGFGAEAEERTEEEMEAEAEAGEIGSMAAHNWVNSAILQVIVTGLLGDPRLAIFRNSAFFSQLNFRKAFALTFRRRVAHTPPDIDRTLCACRTPACPDRPF